MKIGPLGTQDLDAICEIHCAAFPKSALTKLGRQAVFQYYHWLLVGPHDAVYLGVWNEDKLMGFCFAGAFWGALLGFVQQNRRLLFRGLLLRPWLVTDPLFRDRLKLGWRILRHRPIQSPTVQHLTAEQQRIKSFGILVIAVHPHYQGMGAGKALIDETETIARQRDFEELNLSVATNNSQAIRFYERQGWLKSPPDNWKGRMYKPLK